MNRKFKIFITLSLIYTRDFWFCLKHYAWLESSKFNIVWHQNIMVTLYQPRAMSFILTWNDLITLTSDCLVPSELSSWAGQLLADPGHVKATVENPRGILEKMSPEESVEGVNTLPRRKPSHCPAAQCRHPRHSHEGQLFYSAPRIFNRCSDYQNHQFHWQIKPVLTLPLSRLTLY